MFRDHKMTYYVVEVLDGVGINCILSEYETGKEAYEALHDFIVGNGDDIYWGEEDGLNPGCYDIITVNGSQFAVNSTNQKKRSSYYD